jgi:3-oxoacyl-[acyl-carrier-protein] synthase II
MERVVVTGIGAIMPGATGAEAAWAACRVGRSGIAEITAFDASSFPVGVAGEIPDDEIYPRLPEEKQNKVDRFAALAMVAAREALEDAGLDVEASGERIGVFMGSGYSGRKSIDRQNRALYRGGARRVHPRLMQNNITNAASGEIAIDLGLKGANLAYSVGHASGSYALAQALNTLRLGRLSAVLAGGAEAPVLPLVLEEIGEIGEMSARRDDPTAVSRPFDRSRDGFVVSEGAAIVVLERLDHALERGATILAEFLGYGTLYDRMRLKEGRPRPAEMAATIRRAVGDASVDPAEVDYICANGLSTPADDAAEARAIHDAFGGHAARIPVSSVKSVTGHAIAASEVFEAAVCALAIRDGAIPPTINLDEPDEACDLDHVTGKERAAAVRIAVSSTFGIDGNYAALVFGACGE